MLTDQELHKIFSWEPYRPDWIVNRNQQEDNVNLYYGSLINDITQHKAFETYYSEDGGLGNYLEFICFPAGHKEYKGNAILVCVSLCAPVAAYGQTSLQKGKGFLGWGGLFSAEETGIINDHSLTSIEAIIKQMLTQHNLVLLDKVFAGKLLPDEVVEGLHGENHNKGNQYLHGIFQKTD